MKRFGNHNKWSNIYTLLDTQAKNNEKIIFAKIPNDVSNEEIEQVIQELRFLGNFKNYTISRNEYNIKGVRNV